MARHTRSIRAVTQAAPDQLSNLFDNNSMSALDAISEAQRIAFAPIVFQVARTLRETGVLAALDSAGEAGETAENIASDLELSRYGVQVLLEGGMSSGIVDAIDDGRFRISKVGYFLLHDPMTRINMDFNHYLCYQAMFHLDKAITDGTPAGLATLDGNSETIYPVLPHLPEEIKSSWYAFDHFYSDAAYPSALDIIASRRPESLVDIGANQGRFSLLAAAEDDSLRITMIDLPDALAEAEAAITEAGFADRVSAIAADVRDADAEFPENQDAYWLSQFICCFSEPEIESILSRIGARMAPESRLYILETCWDQQKYEAAAFSLINTSLYFSCIANGNSKMYSSQEIQACIERAGLVCEHVSNPVGDYHTLFECRLNEAHAEDRATA